MQARAAAYILGLVCTRSPSLKSALLRRSHTGSCKSGLRACFSTVEGITAELCRSASVLMVEAVMPGADFQNVKVADSLVAWLQKWLT